MRGGEDSIHSCQMWPFLVVVVVGPAKPNVACVFSCYPPSIPFQFRQLFLALPQPPHASGAWFLSGCVLLQLENTAYPPGEGLDRAVASHFCCIGWRWWTLPSCHTQISCPCRLIKTGIHWHLASKLELTTLVEPDGFVDSF